jgi:hypothetical protein
MKPLNIDKTGCSNISSNCVTWQGPDIECINLCKGDSVTEVVYKLALELCSLMDTFDLKNYDLSCFSTGVCQPQTFQDFINILINKVCTLQACNPACGDSCNPCVPPLTNSAMSTSAADTYVPTAKEFHFKSPKGDDVTTLKVSDYAQAIGHKVASIVNSTSILQNSITNHSTRLEALEKKGDPTFQMPMMTPYGVLPKEATPMHLVLAATEQQLTEIKHALGDANMIHSNLQKADPNLNDFKSLAQPGTNLSNLRGFTITPSNLADVLGNTLILVQDMRTALNNLITNYIPNDCEAISLSLTAALKGSQLTLYVQGTLPIKHFKNTNSQGTVFTIADAQGITVTYTINIFDILNLPAGYLIDLSNTRLNTSGNLEITSSPSFTNQETGSMCKSILNYTVINVGICPSVVYTPAARSIDFTFGSSGAMQAYTVKLYDASGRNLLQSQTFVSNYIQTISGMFEKLDEHTLYKVRVEIVINGVTSPCEFTNVTTI